MQEIRIFGRNSFFLNLIYNVKAYLMLWFQSLGTVGFSLFSGAPSRAAETEGEWVR